MNFYISIYSLFHFFFYLLYLSNITIFVEVIDKFLQRNCPVSYLFQIFTEGSNMIEKSYWTILNQHDNDRRIKGKNVCYTFEMKEQREFYRYLHIRQTGTDSGLKYGKLLKCNK